MDYIYMYGMIMSSESFLLCGEYPQADGYGEIDKHFHLLGGETGTAAVILGNLGCSLVLGGTHLGNVNGDIILNSFEGMDVDTSKLVHEDYNGIVDYILIDKNTRTCFGEWGKHYSRSVPFYEQPDEESVKNSAVVGADPFFGPKIVELCRKYNKKYATIDCTYDSEFHRYAEVDAISHQHLKSVYPDKTIEELYKLYTNNTDGLTIFTFGENEVIYGRKGCQAKRFKPYNVDTVSTLGAGDSFKAGTIYALYKGMSDDDIVRYGCAVAGVACTQFPIPLNPPTLERVAELINSRKG